MGNSLLVQLILHGGAISFVNKNLIIISATIDYRLDKIYIAIGILYILYALSKKFLVFKNEVNIHKFR